MTIETRLRSAAEDARNTIRGLTPPPVGPRVPRVAWTWAAATVAVVIVIAAIMWPSVGEPDPAQPGPGETVLTEGPPLVVQGATAPEPKFDPSPLGEEVELAQLDDPEVTNLIRQVENTVIGRNGDLAKITVAGVLDGGWMVAGILGEDPGDSCVWIGSASHGFNCYGIPDSGLPTYGTSSQGTTIWGPLPPDTSVVRLTVDNEGYWQRPVGGIAAFDVGLVAGSDDPLAAADQRSAFVFTAFDRDGNIIHQAGEVASETYEDESGNVLIATDCPAADQFIAGNGDGLPTAGSTDFEDALAYLERGGRGAIVPRNGEVWSRDAGGEVTVSRVQDYMIQIFLDDVSQCPSVPFFSGLPQIFMVAGE